MRYTPINNYLFTKNRQKLAHKLPAHALVIVVSNDEMPRTADQFYPYRQNSDLFYLTGIEQPKTILCICPDYFEPHLKEILFIEKPTERQLTWHGNKLSFEQAAAISGIKNVFWLDEFEPVLNSLMQHARYVYLSFHENARTFDEVPLRDSRFTEKIKDLYPLHHYERLSPITSAIREVKETEELQLVEKAIDITSVTFNKILKHIKDSIKEYEIEAEIIAEFIRNGASGHAFAPIIASGGNACVLHYEKNNSLCNNGDLVLIDFGAEYANYNADVTRTIPVNGCFTNRQREVYNAVLRIHNQALSLMKPGASLEKINQGIIAIFEDELVGLKLLAKNEIKNQDPDKPVYKKYFMHGIGHFLGLDVHDTGSKQDVFYPGTIITCEPGIYIAAENIGIRLENDILITNKGNRNLTAAIPIEADDIEECMARAKSDE